MNVREKLVEIIQNSVGGCAKHWAQVIADGLVANGVTVQDETKDMIGRGLENIYWRMYGANKEFNERMAGYNPSAFCAGFEYAIQLAKGLLTQLPKPPKGE